MTESAIAPPRPLRPDTGLVSLPGAVGCGMVLAVSSSSPPAARWRALVSLSVAELLALSLWFSASAVLPALAREWRLGDAGAAALTIAVQLGFILGTLGSALGNLPDVWSPRSLMVASCALGAVANAAVALWVDSLGPALILRFVTGIAMAGAYPPAMKIMATWFREGRGLAIGILIGALTVGSAVPYLIRGLTDLAWRHVLLAASLLADRRRRGRLGLRQGGPAPVPLGALRRAHGGRGLPRSRRAPGLLRLSRPHVGAVRHVGVDRPVPRGEPGGARRRLLRRAQCQRRHVPGHRHRRARLLDRGWASDRWGRTALTMIAMAASGTCALGIGFTFAAAPALTLLVAGVWGITVIADSAQFSTAVTELSPPAYVGTALTTQTCAGFALTMLSIWMIPPAVRLLGWRWAFATLAIGPFLGVLAMGRLRLLPEASRMASGRR